MSDTKFTPGHGTLVFDNRKMHEGEYKGPFEVDYSVYLRCRERETALKEKNQELLEALEELVSATTSVRGIDEDMENFYCTKAFMKARKAISKAKGESYE